jgi:hypothetical protein
LLGYCNSGKEYKENWQVEITKFYNFISNLPLVKKLEDLQIIWNQFSKKNLIYEFIIGKNGLIFNDNPFLFKMKTFTYKKYYKNLSLYNKSRKMKEKGYKYLWHYKTLNKREQKRKIKANIIHMLDATWNIFTCQEYKYDIATIHDCHGVHSIDVQKYFEVVREVLVCLFKKRNQYFDLLNNMLRLYLYNGVQDIEFKKKMYKKIQEHESFFMSNIWKWFQIRNSKYLFIPK